MIEFYININIYIHFKSQDLRTRRKYFGSKFCNCIFKTEQLRTYLILKCSTLIIFRWDVLSLDLKPWIQMSVKQDFSW